MSGWILTMLLFAIVVVSMEGNDKVGDKGVVETLSSVVKCRLLYLFTDAMYPAVVSLDVEDRTL